VARDQILKVTNLVKKFGEFEAVRGISFEVSRGEVLGILGPNGAGKTTTLHIILGLISPTSGEINVFGMDLLRERHKILQRVNFCSAYTSLPGNLTVQENLDIFARLYSVVERKKKIQEVLDLLEIPHIATKVTGVLSSGQKTRLNLCKSLLNDPELLFLDEPTASLDPDIAVKIRSILERIRKEKGTAMVYTSHNMREVEAICDRILFLSSGKIITQGTPAEVLAQANSTSLEEVFITIARDGKLVDTRVKEEE
jgi:ABC-2 type transport system ATP-binding protein